MTISCTPVALDIVAVGRRWRRCTRFWPLETRRCRDLFDGGRGSGRKADARSVRDRHYKLLARNVHSNCFLWCLIQALVFRGHCCFHRGRQAIPAAG